MTVRSIFRQNMMVSVSGFGEEIPQLFDRHGAGIPVSLEVGGGHAFAALLVGLVLDALEQDGVAHVREGGGHVLQQQLGPGVGPARFDHGPVELDDVEGQGHNPLQVRIAGAEVVQVDFDALLPELPELVPDEVEVALAAGLGQLQGDPVRRPVPETLAMFRDRNLA